MKKLYYPLVFLALFLLPVLSLSAWDIGLLMDQTAGLESPDNTFTYTGTLIPWYSVSFGDTGKLYISAGVTADYQNVNGIVIPELLRTEFSYRIGNGNEIKAGRMLYSDPLGFIAHGLFDGARFSNNSGLGTIGFGVWYTGLLYKTNAEITITNEDLVSYSSGFSYAKFADSYFASRRLLAAVDWEYPDLMGLLRLKAALMGQFDLNDRENRYHSQYLVFKAGMPLKSFIFDLGFCVEAAELSGEDSDPEFNIGFAGELGVGWRLPTPITDSLNFTARLSNGKMDDDSVIAAFVPITTMTQGDIIKAKLSGLSMLRLDYSFRLGESFLFNLADSYFILSDLGTYSGLPGGRDGHFLGNEFSGRLIWSPLSDLRLDLGGGVFLPSMGNAAAKEDPIWRVELNAVLIFF